MRRRARYFDENSAIGGLQESELTGRVDGLYGRDRLTFVLFYTCPCKRRT
jgi:hypothetical protein